MSFKNAAVFPFPAVQYIPLSITNILRGRFTKLSSKISLAQIIAGAELSRWRSVLWQDFGLQIPEIFPVDSFPVLALNLAVIEVKYRGYFVTMLGQENNGNYQLFTLPKRYFYKKKLYFEIFDQLTGKQLAQYSLFMP